MESLFATVQCECSDLGNETDKYLLKSSSDTMTEWPSHYFGSSTIQAQGSITWCLIGSEVQLAHWMFHLMLIGLLFQCLLAICYLLEGHYTRTARQNMQLWSWNLLVKCHGLKGNISIKNNHLKTRMDSYNNKLPCCCSMWKQ